MFDQTTFDFGDAAPAAPPSPPEPPPEPPVAPVSASKRAEGVILRPYQLRAVEAVEDALSRGEAPVVPAPTGSGKTLLMGELARRHLERGGSRVLVATHRASLVTQQARAAEAMGLDPSVFSAGLGAKDLEGDLILSTIQSVVKRVRKTPEAFEDVGLVIVDEAHRIPLSVSASGQYRTMLSLIKQVSPDCRLVGLTATPYVGHPAFEGNAYSAARDGRGRWRYGIGETGPVFDVEVGKIAMSELVQHGFLVEPRFVRHRTVIDTSDLEVDRKTGDYKVSDMDSATIAIADQLADDFEHEFRAQRRKAGIGLTAGVDAAEEMRDALRQRGMHAELVTQSTPEREREALYAELRNPYTELECVCGVNVPSEGLDIPAADILGLWRATKSPVLYVQACGRVLRPYPGKVDGLILDHGENGDRFGEDLDAVGPVIKKRAGEKPGPGGGGERDPWAGVRGLPLGHPLLPGLESFVPRRVAVWANEGVKGPWAKVVYYGAGRGEKAGTSLFPCSERARAFTRRKLRALGVADKDLESFAPPGDFDAWKAVLEPGIALPARVYGRMGQYGLELVCSETPGGHVYFDPKDEKAAKTAAVVARGSVETQQARAAKMRARFNNGS